ncbi:MAG: hypothetical protein RIR11_1312 [Bacteroidota bacterium]|jgi:hypothetical protein
MPCYRIFAVTYLLFCTFCDVFAQEIQINEGAKVADMMSAWTTANQKNQKIEGWRVQVLSTTDRQQVEAARAKVALEFPDQYVDWINEKPYYKLRVGACRTRTEALGLVSILKDFYPSAYPAKESNIHPRDFLSKQ